MTIVARHLTMMGRVQGVFYRKWTVTTALQLGLVGWVRNRLNGDVEALVQGESADVEHFIELARQGPPAARVDDLRSDLAEISDFRTFEQRATA